ncbi:hypothetical protein CJF25_21535 [Photobacterium phosphoreum]|jgi:hypothetical protein|uniref:hypothetical protein n=1 Tax=Photobacterium phosphoreum TaxID=659 RepID=UPI001E505A79|nr:hypothetical protein [Photobacterium phosphoreum]MCD9465497.1 hypothetical protein [Photobacterium phosphoreum]
MKGKGMSLKNTLVTVANLARTWPSNKTDEMKSLADSAYNQGWYLNEVFIFGLHFSEHDNFDDNVIAVIDEGWSDYWEMLSEYQPARSELFNEIRKCHEAGLYGAAINLCFSQADGIFYDKFEKSLYGSGFNIAKSQFNEEINEFISRDSLETLRMHYKDKSLFKRMFNEVYLEVLSKTRGDLVKNTKDTAESSLSIPNRHGVIHGVHTEYATKLGSYKVIAFLLFIFYALKGL